MFSIGRGAEGTDGGASTCPPGTIDARTGSARRRFPCTTLLEGGCEKLADVTHLGCRRPIVWRRGCRIG